jgi:type I restriction enzyme S subunit
MSQPALRFRNDDGQEFPEWEETNLGDIATFSKGKGISKADIEVNGLTPCIRYGELYTEYRETINEVKSRTNIPVKSLILSETNDVIIPASGETQIDIATASCVQLSGVALGGDLNIIKSQQDGVFLSYYLNSRKKLDIAKLAQGNSVVHLYSSQLKLLDLNLPVKSEQTKIANFITAVDEKISQLTQKHDLLNQYKKGVMQQIFSQELRFKDDDGQDFPEWEEATLGEIVKFQNGKGHESIINEDGKYIVVNSKFIASSGKVFKCSVKALTPIASDTNVMVMSDVPNGKALGKCFFISEDNRFTLNQRICALKSDKYHNKFLYYLINRNPHFLSFDSGVGQTNLKKEDVLSCPLVIPISTNEQTKIANFLTAIDDKITATQAQLKAVKQYKQGLLQQMFV